MKIGDIVRNGYAGDNNPHRIGMFIGMSSHSTGPYSKKETIILLHSDGVKSPYYFDRKFFKVMDHIEILEMLNKYINETAPKKRRAVAG